MLCMCNTVEYVIWYQRVLKNHDKTSFDQNMNFYIHQKKSQNCRANLTYIITAIRALTDTAITKIITATTHLIVMVTKSFLKLVIQFLKKTKIFSKYEKFLLLTGSEVATTNKFISLLFSALNTICMQHFTFPHPPFFFFNFSSAYVGQ